MVNERIIISIYKLRAQTPARAHNDIICKLNYTSRIHQTAPLAALNGCSCAWFLGKVFRIGTVRYNWPNAHVCTCVTGLQHSTLYRFGRFAVSCDVVLYRLCKYDGKYEMPLSILLTTV